MKYMDENGAALESVDLSKGFLTDVEWIEHAEVQEKGHFEYEALPGGGRMQKYVIDTPYQPAYREVTVQRYTPYTEEELAAMNRSYSKQIEALNVAVAEQRAALEALIGGAEDA